MAVIGRRRVEGRREETGREHGPPNSELSLCFFLDDELIGQLTSVEVYSLPIASMRDNQDTNKYDKVRGRKERESTMTIERGASLVLFFSRPFKSSLCANSLAGGGVVDLRTNIRMADISCALEIEHPAGNRSRPHSPVIDTVWQSERGLEHPPLLVELLDPRYEFGA